jgi:GTP-binding protein
MARESDGPQVARADYERSCASPADWPEAGPPEVALCGRSNVGKSTLLNLLASRRGLARVSGTPGRTRLINFFLLELVEGGARRTVRLVDLPGFGYAKVSKQERSTWRPAIERYLADRAPLKAVALLVDARRGAELDERELAPWIARRGVAVVPVLTKSDRLAKHERKLAAEAASRALGAKAVLTAAERGEGRADLWRRLLAALGSDEPGDREHATGNR